MLVLLSSGVEGVGGTLAESKSTRSLATAVQIARSEVLGEVTFSSSEEQQGLSVVRNVACSSHALANLISPVARLSRESASRISLAGVVPARE